MSQSTLTKRIEFSASHRYHNPSWDAGRNRAVFGICHKEPRHGPNYLLEVTIGGTVDPITGMIINLYDLKRVLVDIVEEFDHKHLNLDTPYFQEIIPTTENLAVVFWNIISQRPETKEVESVRVYEGEDLFSEVRAEGNDSRVITPAHTDIRVTRRYRFSSGFSGPDNTVSWSSCILDITISGPIAPDTGRVVDIDTVDTLVQQQILKRFHQQDLTNLPAFGSQPASPEHVSCLIQSLLEPHMPSGHLDTITLTDSQGTATQFCR